MNPIEHFWDYVDRMVCARDQKPKNQDEMWDVLQEEWNQVPLDYITKLFESMPCRVAALKGAKGWYTKY